jgi:hypothetical protein
MPEQATFDQWGIVEIMGHNRIAGRIREQAIGGTAFVRVDVPQIDGQPAFTKLFGSSSIFSISLTSEETACAVATRLAPGPISTWDAREAVAAADRLQTTAIEAPAVGPDDDGELPL